jgi:hypothetical protein
MLLYSIFFGFSGIGIRLPTSIQLQRPQYALSEVSTSPTRISHMSKAPQVISVRDFRSEWLRSYGP